MERVKLLHELMTSKDAMEEDLRQMTTLLLKLNEKVKREGAGDARGERSPLRDD